MFESFHGVQGKMVDGHGKVEIWKVETHIRCTQFPLRFKGKWLMVTVESKYGKWRLTQGARNFG